MNILILDHDGVICLANNFGSRYKKNTFHEDEMKLPVEKRFDDFDKKAIKVLNKIIENTNCEIVMSSDWKLWSNLEEMGDYYIQQGIIKKPLDFTPFIDNVIIPEDYKWGENGIKSQERVLEIKDWLSKHNDVEKWVAVDDLFLGNNVKTVKFREWGLDNFVHCPLVNEGIKQAGVYDKIMGFLS